MEQLARRTYKIGDMVLEGKKIYSVVVAPISTHKIINLYS